MESKFFKDDGKIYDHFELQWSRTPSNWPKFIASRDIGIRYVSNEDGVIGDNYEIVDGKKWFLFKLKHGI